MMLQGSVPGCRADPVFRASHAHAIPRPSPAHAIARADAAFRHAPTPRDTAASQKLLPAVMLSCAPPANTPTGKPGPSSSMVHHHPLRGRDPAVHGPSRPAVSRPNHDPDSSCPDAGLRRHPRHSAPRHAAVHGSARLYTCRLCDPAGAPPTHCRTRTRHGFPCPRSKFDHLGPFLWRPGPALATTSFPPP
jgi:hypothetical protein